MQTYSVSQHSKVHASILVASTPHPAPLQLLILPTACHSDFLSGFSHYVSSILYPLLFSPLSDSTGHVQSTFSLCLRLLQMPLTVLSHISIIMTFPLTTPWSGYVIGLHNSDQGSAGSGTGQSRELKLCSSLHFGA